MQDLELCESDHRFMMLLWEHGTIGSGQLVELAASRLGWKKSTTYTVLKKLCEKGFAQNENTIVTALVPREQVQAYASAHFIDHTFGGSLPAFLAAFSTRKKLTDQEIDEMKNLIENMGG